jgi:hypothetical protein
VVARNGADENAIRAAKGALKENGKLVIAHVSGRQMIDCLH